LKESDRRFYNPKGFCDSFKEADGTPINVHEQRDVDEFLNLFMEKCENFFKLTQFDQLIKELFTGFYSNELIGKDCPHRR
jgi:hypothetical protein